MVNAQERHTGGEIQEMSWADLLAGDVDVNMSNIVNGGMIHSNMPTIVAKLAEISWK